MARNIMRAGSRVVVCDIDERRAARLAEAGAEIAGTPEDVASRSWLSIAMIMDDDALRDVAQGVAKGGKPGHLFCDLSTVSPSTSVAVGKLLSERGIRYLRGKVVGSVQPATEATLTILASGERDDFELAAPILRSMGETLHYLGPGEVAHYLKLVHSVIVAVYAAMLAEALAFGEKGGVDWSQMLEILADGPLSSRQLTVKHPTILARDFDNPPADIDTAAKDIDIILAAAREMAVPMPISSLVRQFMAHQQAIGEGKRDIWSVVEAFERFAGLAPGAS